MPCPFHHQFHQDPGDHPLPPPSPSHAYSAHSPNHSPRTPNSYHPPPIRRPTDTASTHPAEDRWAPSRSAATPRPTCPSLRTGNPSAIPFPFLEPCPQNGSCLGHRFRPLGGGHLVGVEGCGSWGAPILLRRRRGRTLYGTGPGLPSSLSGYIYRISLETRSDFYTLIALSLSPLSSAPNFLSSPDQYASCLDNLGRFPGS